MSWARSGEDQGSAWEETTRSCQLKLGHATAIQEGSSRSSLVGHATALQDSWRAIPERSSRFGRVGRSLYFES